MAAPSYTTDLTLIDLADAVTNWAESSDANWDDGGPPSQETDYFIHNGGTAACISATASVAKGNHSTLIVNNGSGITIPTDGAVLIWCFFQAPNVLDTLANGGLKLLIGSGLGDFYYWIVGGSNFGRNPYGGWENFAVDSAQTQDGTVGSPTSTEQYFGIAHKILTAISKGNPFGVDVVRYGRCEARFANGDLTNGYCTFAGFAAANDAVGARWGLIQAIPGGYLWKGLITIGYSTAADFRDSNVSLLIDDTRKVSSAFNKIEIRQSGTRVDWTNVKIESLGTVARGIFTVVDNADINFDACQFIGMDTFTLLANSEILNSTFRGCNAITMSGAGKLNGSSVIEPTIAADASAVVWNLATDPDGYLDNMTFEVGSNAHHAINLGASAPLTTTFRGMTTSGFNASNGQNDSTFYLSDRGSDQTWTINVVGGSGNFSYKKARAGDTVNMVIDPVTATVTVKDGIAKTAVEGAAVTLKASGSGPYPYNLSISNLVQTGGTATATTASAHGLTTGDKVWIKGASPNDYNRIKTVTVTGTTTFTYPINSGASSPATGTITCTMVFIDELTGPTGIVTDSRVFSSDQNVDGWVSKGTKAPLYVRQELSDKIDDTDGLSLTVLLQSDA
jgi:hypothetical protein